MRSTVLRGCPYTILLPTVAVEFVLNVSGVEPRTLTEAVKCPDGQMYLDVAIEEMKVVVNNGTWELVSLPAGRKAIGSYWVFRIKWHLDGSVECYKAHLVAKGYSQRPGVDYIETFAPTTKFAALCTVLAIAAVEDLELHSLYGIIVHRPQQLVEED